MCPDFPTPKSEKKIEKAQEKAPALNVNIFIAFLDVSGVVYFFTVFYFLTNLKNILILLHKNCWIPKSATFFGFCAFRNLQKLGRKEGSKSATFARNRKIWTHCSIDSEYSQYTR